MGSDMYSVQVWGVIYESGVVDKEEFICGVWMHAADVGNRALEYLAEGAEKGRDLGFDSYQLKIEPIHHKSWGSDPVE